MRISLISAHFYPSTTYGGPISLTWDLSRKLAEKNIQIYVSTTNANGKSKLDVGTNTFIEINKNLYIKYYNEQIINKFSFAFILNIYDDIKSSDIVYIQYIFHYTVLFSLFFSFFLKKKVIICPRGSVSHYSIKNKNYLIKKIWLRFLIAPFKKRYVFQASSKLEKKDLLHFFPNSNTRILNDPIDYESFQNFKIYEREKLIFKFTKINFNYVSKIFFSMGRLHSIKRFDILIDAFSLFVIKNPNAKLIIAGNDDGVEDKLKIQIKKLNLQKTIFLVGAVNFRNKNILLNNCDYFTLASDYESFGIVIAEALACGKPIIVSNKTRWKDLEENNYGIFVENETKSFAKAFNHIMEKKFDSKKIKFYAKSNFDICLIADKFLKQILK